jgi:hypothetical protein
MIEKIVSGGQTGVDQAALDAAIKLGIPYGGWIPKGRKTENGPLPEKYNMREMPTSTYSHRTEQNVIDADGTLIISHGRLTDGSEYTRKMAMKHNRPWLHIDISKRAKFHAATSIVSWIAENSIRILNVAGPRASKDPEIYLDALNIIESAYYLEMIEESTSASYANEMQKLDRPSTPPTTADDAVMQLISEMTLKAKTTVANMSEAELMTLHASLGRFIIDKFALLSGNEGLVTSCRLLSGENHLNDDDVAAIIIRKLWQDLRNTHKLRIIK